MEIINMVSSITNSRLFCDALTGNFYQLSGLGAEKIL